MTTNATICPSSQALADFGLGRLDGASVETIGAHLETCGECRRVVADLPSDSFIDRLRAAHGHTASTAESVSHARGVTPANRPAKIGAQADAKAVPQALADHPGHELIRELGRGGMGVVYLARNRLMDRLEVLKVLNRTLVESPDAAERFQREIRSAARLAHPNIVAAYSVQRLGELLVFCMEFVDGQDLSQIVKKHGPLPVPNAAYYAQQAALGLQHAHESGMVHRDVKPNNLMLAIANKKHVVKILDFGLAKATIEKVDSGGLTKSGQMLGTPDYIAPEQTLDAQQADIRADVYSLGCTLYFLLAGRPPFEGGSLYEILNAHHRVTAQSLHLLRPEVPPELAAVVAKMMAKDPAHRFQTPDEVAQALGPFSKVAPASGSGGLDKNPPTHAKAAPSPPPLPPTAPPLPPAVSPVADLAPAGNGPDQGSAMPSAPPLVSLAHAEARGAARDHASRMAGPRAMQLAVRRRTTVAMIIGLMLGIGGILGAVIFKFRTADGVVVIEVNVDHPKVFVDGNRATVTWDAGGSKAEIALPAGSRKIELKKDGFRTLGETVELERGDRVILVASLERLNDADAPAASSASGPDLARPATSATNPANLVPASRAASTAAGEASSPPTSRPDDAPPWPPGTPAPAIAPFDARQAQAHQAAWAAHLHVPVEQTNSLDMNLVLIPPGEFMMGSTEEDIRRIQRTIQTTHGRNATTHATQTKMETPRHRVRITRPFWMASHETTVANFTAFVDATQHLTDAERDGRGGQIAGPNGWVRGEQYTWKNSGMPQGDRIPVTQLSWHDAVAFCQWLSRKEQRRYRLPTEAEWEYCCRGGTTTDWCSGDDPQGFNQVAWYIGDSGRRVQPVQAKRPNAFGLYDFHGNAWEWCQDRFGAYPTQTAVDPQGNDASTERVMRGGAAILPADLTRSAWRWSCPPENRDFVTGCRVVREFDPPPEAPTESGRTDSVIQGNDANSDSNPAH